MEALQREIRRAARFVDDLAVDPTDPAAVRAATVVGVDQAFLDDRAVSALVAVRDGRVVERAHAVTPLEVPYVPGLLAFREGGPILAAFAELAVAPDLALFDGSGRIHFRQAGIATHVGVALDLPSVGVAKSLLCGVPDEPVDGRPEGWRTPIRADERVEANAAGGDGDDEGHEGAGDEGGVGDREDRGDREDGGRDDEAPVVGYAYQSRQYPNEPVVNPLYVSPGHRVANESAVEVVAALCEGYKLPEPTRLADAYADEVKAEYADE
jgi:deoxyribonuclease V